MNNVATARLLAQIAQELSESYVVFPTSFDITLRVQHMLKEPDISVEMLAKVVKTEPLISSKLLAYANSAALRGGGPELIDLTNAIMRIGFEAVRTVTYTLAVEQIIRSKEMLPFQALSKAIWEHSLAVASIARQLARRQRMNREKAFFMGIVHDIGVFYLLFRCGRDPSLEITREELLELVYTWHDGIGHALLAAMDQSEDILTAVQDHESPCEILHLNNWTSILQCADHLSQTISDWVPEAMRANHRNVIPESVLSAEEQTDILAQAADELDSLRATLNP